jgi:CHAT domain-containing protein/tetratricopeptide (TPR) repeat protein
LIAKLSHLGCFAEVGRLMRFAAVAVPVAIAASNILAPAHAAQPAQPPAAQGQDRAPPTVAADDFLQAEALGSDNCRQAELLYRRALAEQERALGPNHIDTIRTVFGLARCVSLNTGTARGEGLALVRRAFDGYRANLGLENPETERAGTLLVRLYEILDDHAGLEQMSALSLRHLEQRASEGRLANGEAFIDLARRQLASAIDAQGRRTEAEAVHDAVIRSLTEAEQQLLPLLRAEQAAVPVNGLIIQSTDNQARGVRLLTRLFAQAEALSASNRFEKALRLYQSAAQLAQLIGGEGNVFFVRAVTDRASAETALGNYEAAERSLLQSVAIRQQIYGADNPQRIVAYGPLSALYRRLGRYDEAERALLTVLGIGGSVSNFSEALLDSRAGGLAIHIALADLFQEQGRYQEAASILEGVLQFFDSGGVPQTNPIITAIVPGARNSGEMIRAQAALALARVYLAQNNLAQAEELTARYAEAPGTRGDQRQDFRFVLAQIRRAQTRYPEAELLFRQILAQAEQDRSEAGQAAVLIELAQLELRRGAAGAAEPLLSRAAGLAEQQFGASHPMVLAAQSGRVAALLEMPGRSADALAVARQLVAARRDRGSRATEYRGDQQRDRELFRSVAWPVFLADAIWSARSTGGGSDDLTGEALEALQDALLSPGSVALARAAARRDAGQSNGELSALVRRREALITDLSSQDAAILAGLGLVDDASESQRQNVLAETQRREGELREVDSRIAALSPRYAELIRPRPLSVTQAQALMSPGEAAIIVVPGDRGTHVMSVTREGVTWHRSSWNAERVRAAVQRLRWDAGALVDGSDEELAALQSLPQGQRPSFDRSTAHALYDTLIAPLAGSLQNKTRIFIAAGGSLAGLPFHILVAAPPSGADDDPAALRATQWFGDGASLVHIPSLQSLALLRRSEPRRPSASSFIGVGNPVLGDTTSERGRARGRGISQQIRIRPGRLRDGGVLADLSSMRSLSSLPGTAVELEAVRLALGAPQSSLLTADRATEPNVRSARVYEARIMLFSTHGLTATEATGVGEAGLVLTPPDGEARDGDDGFLAASEVTTLRLDADWVILSACNTATGDGIDNPGLGPLARAFFYAGARNLLASHWPVSDDVAPILITRTLELERDGSSRADALSRAMREIRMNTSQDATDSWAHPFYWAPFVLVGG